MKILIPLGGVGKRFSDANYTTPKPLIKVLGKPILFWVIDNLNLTEEDVEYIRSVPKTYGSGVKLAREFGVKPIVISAIRNNKAWKPC